MKYNTIIFDLDGTISNTESGIFKAFRKMMKEFGVDESKFDLKKFIGPPIQWSFYQIFGDDMRLFKALDYFRGVYLDFMTDNTLYDGVKELLEKLAADTCPPGSVVFAGWVTDMDSFYHALDVNTLTSISETFPYAITEGARMRCATIASNVGGIPYIIEHGVTGLLFLSLIHI